MMYDFRGLIRSHSKAFTLITKKGGSYVGGKWENGTESVSERSGAIIPLAERKVYHSGGTYTNKDRNLYMTTPIEGALDEVQVKYKGNLYNVEEEKDFSDYSDAYAYVLKWVSSFD